MRCLAILLVSGILTTAIRAQTVIFSERFENGLAVWIDANDGNCGEQIYGGAYCAGNWQVLDTADPCSAWALPFPSGNHAAWFGIAGQCNYDAGWDFACNRRLTLASPVQLPGGVASIALRFHTKSEGEADSLYDVRSVNLSTNGGQSYVNLGVVWNSDWSVQSYDLTPWAGQSILIKFKFDTYDTSFNNYHGWYLDDVVIESGSETGVRFCAGDGTSAACACGNFGASGHGCGSSFAPSGASLGGSGAASVSADTVTLSASGLSSSVVTLFQGTAQQAFGLGVLFGDGLRCAGGSVLRLKAAFAGGGAVSFPLPGDPPLSIAGLIPAGGGVRTYQVWYRNAAAFCTSSTFNLTNGLILSWQP